MKISLRNFLSGLVAGRSADALRGEPLSLRTDSSGLLLYTNREAFEELQVGRGSERARVQLVVLRMLLEQGQVEELPNGFRLDAETVAALEEEQAELLELPPPLAQPLVTRIQGHTRRASFSVQLLMQEQGERYACSLDGPFLLTQGRTYRLNPPQLRALQAVERHAALPPEERTEERNLQLMAELQAAREQGLEVDLGSFNVLDVVVPESIGIQATSLPDGSLELSPALGEGSTPEQLEQRLHQLNPEAESGVLRVDERLVLLEPEKMAAVREVLGNRRIPAEQVQDFLKTPTAFLDASLVNLDLGFSLRVLGVGAFRHLEFGELDDRRQDWFASDQHPQPPEILERLIHCEEELESFRDRWTTARQQGASSLDYQGEWIDLTDPERVETVLGSIEENMAEAPADRPEPTPSAEDRTAVTLLLKESELVGQALHDKLTLDVARHEMDCSRLLRAPYEHQQKGIEWMLELLARAQAEDREDLYRVQGALLADDMGLGKTFMSLVMLAEYLAMQEARGEVGKPLLVVAPLSLLESWEEEVVQTFRHSPFRDVKVLQSSRDLHEFRIQGAGRETSLSTADLKAADDLEGHSLRYSLKVGPEAGPRRLDLDRRLVLTTYQTLRDYQFSLCVIDWGVVIFDEAQEIKNPNTLQTRAAKALKADFKLLVTGTPVENTLMDFWCLMDTAQPGLLGNWPEFRSRWVQPVTQAEEEERDAVRLKIGRDLRAAVGRFMLRRIKEEELPGLPSRQVRSAFSSREGPGFQEDPELAATMTGAQLQAYDDALEQYRTERAERGGKGLALRTLHRLRSISLHPELEGRIQLHGSDGQGPRAMMKRSAKLAAVLKQLDRIQATGEKVILFTQTKSLQRALKLWLDQIYGLDIQVINGDAPAGRAARGALTRKQMIDQFERVAGFNLLIMSPIAAGVGLTVVGANHVIHVERHWNPAKEAQASDRVYRIGQEKEVFVYLPAALHPEHDSFDVHLDRLLSSKLLIKDAVVTTNEGVEQEMVRSMGL